MTSFFGLRVLKLAVLLWWHRYFFEQEHDLAVFVIVMCCRSDQQAVCVVGRGRNKGVWVCKLARTTTSDHIQEVCEAKIFFGGSPVSKNA